MSVRVVPVVDAPWDDVRTVFGTRGDPARCWCQYFKVTAATWKAQDIAGFERGLCDQVDAARTSHGAGPGLLAYEGDDPVGWVAIEPRPAYPRILSSRMAEHSAEPADAEDVWFVSCFVVRVGHRRKGIAGALLAGAVEHARANGARVVEAFPVQALPGTSSADLYHGPLSAFEAAGFEVVARPAEARAVVRLALG
ncbi:MAG: GNAT family N-acetyltransferase [Microbacteriaceae bacterium]|nr:GNAT family N-acetyltransferase [Microbacteriaceae bacterium]